MDIAKNILNEIITSDSENELESMLVLEAFRQIFVPNLLEKCDILYGIIQIEQNKSLSSTVSAHLIKHHSESNSFYDFVFVLNENKNTIKDNDPIKLHLTVDNKLLEYVATGYICLNESNSYMSYIAHNYGYYTIQNDSSKVVTQRIFRDMISSAVFILFKLETDISETHEKIPLATLMPEKTTNDNSKMTSIAEYDYPSEVFIPKKKVKIVQSNISNHRQRIWLNGNSSGRETLYNEQQRLLSGIHTMYDDLIMNSVANMINNMYPCNYQHIRAHSVEYLCHIEDVNARFVQVIHISPNHWVVISNKLTKDPDDVEVFDSLYKTYFNANKQLNVLDPESCHVAKAVLQIKPGAKSINYIHVQQQLPKYNGCGPLTLGNFWSLARGIYPNNWLHYHEQSIRQIICRIIERGFIENVIPSKITMESLSMKKTVVKKFVCDFDNTLFYLS